MKNSDFKKAFEGKHIDANYVKFLLEDNDISAFLKNDTMGQMFPLFVADGSLHPVQVFVDKENLKKAQEIVSAYFKS